MLKKILNNLKGDKDQIRENENSDSSRISEIIKK